jgi:hypothetical protein
MTEEIHDTSRIDAFMASRRRAMFLHSMWRPMLAGAAGAALIIGAVWVASPRLHYNEIEVPRVTLKDVIVPNVIEKDVAVPNIIQKDVVVDHVVTLQPQVNTAPIGPDSPYAAKTPDEDQFVNTPEYKDAIYRGRIVKSVDGRALSFADGRKFWPSHIDPKTGEPAIVNNMTFDSDALVGELGMCVQDKGNKLWACSAMHDGKVIGIVWKKVNAIGSRARTTSS